jgi:hypothetical protein
MVLAPGTADQLDPDGKSRAPAPPGHHRNRHAGERERLGEHADPEADGQDCACDLPFGAAECEGRAGAGRRDEERRVGLQRRQCRGETAAQALGVPDPSGRHEGAGTQAVAD